MWYDKRTCERALCYPRLPVTPTANAERRTVLPTGFPARDPICGRIGWAERPPCNPFHRGGWRFVWDADRSQAGKTTWVECFSGKGAGTGGVSYATAEEAANAITMLNGSDRGSHSVGSDRWMARLARVSTEEVDG